LSCDHLENLSERGVRAMRAAGTVAVLLPGAYYFLRDTQLPPIAALREHGVPIAVATDHNPGSSPALSLPLMIHMACTLFRLTPEEALRGSPCGHAARRARGSLARPARRFRLGSNTSRAGLPLQQPLPPRDLRRVER
jgi:imidazolonepropionase